MIESMIDQVAPNDTVVNSINRSAENRTPNCCLLFDSIGARRRGVEWCRRLGTGNVMFAANESTLGSPVRFVIYRDIVNY